MNKENAQILAGGMQVQQVPTPKYKETLEMLSSDKVQKNLEKLMPDRYALFTQTVKNVLLMPESKALRECTPVSIVRAAMACCSTGLSPEPAFGESALVPFGDKCTFMPMKNGLIKLANRSGFIARINSCPVYDGDILRYDPFTGDYIFNEQPHERTKLVGWMAYLRLTTGGDHYLYMTVEELDAHGQRYSKSFYRKNGLWQTNRRVMYEKTVLKQILMKWGALDTMGSVPLANALRFDGAAPTGDDVTACPLEYPDGGPAEWAEYEEADTDGGAPAQE